MSQPATLLVIKTDNGPEGLFYAPVSRSIPTQFKTANNTMRARLKKGTVWHDLTDSRRNPPEFLHP